MRDPNATAWQKRNSSWLASHPGTVAAAGAWLFGAGGVGYGALVNDDVRWLGPVVGGLIGVLLGAMLGWGFSVENRERRPRGLRMVLYGTALAMCIGVVLGMKYIRYSN